MNLLRSLVVVAFAAALVAGCGGSAGGGGGSIARDYDLSGAKFTVGSKEFGEQLILGNITKRALQEAGASVNDQIGLAGSNAARTALTSGQIDMYWEYLGTIWTGYLKETGDIPGNDYQTVSERDLKENNIELLDPGPWENGYVIATNRRTADKFGLRTLSDLGTFIEKNPEEATMCAGGEFAVRDDGLPGLQKAYGWEFPQSQVTRLQDGLVYERVANGEPCNFGSVFATDGRISNLDLVPLEDDQDFFPPFVGVLSVRGEVYDKYPQLADLFAPISQQLTTEEMKRLNRQVDEEGRSPEQVADQFLRDNGFTG